MILLSKASLWSLGSLDTTGAKTDTHWQPQRGRDHGLPGYNRWQRKCGLQPFMTFDSMSQVMRKGDINVFKRMYKSVEDIDLYPAGLAERGQNSLLGPTFSCIVAQQFNDLRHGDRFWYKNNQQLDHPFSTRQLAAIRAVGLASILCEHTTISSLQRNPFLVPNPGSCSRNNMGPRPARWKRHKILHV
ncbi:hypothetical protein Pcinc_001196 [Petrolisthes cinctipes]|uniref:Peroxidase n=1 Tax=Petrolisthes cinctipes TaxID=88211 RepID=A0AAE1KWF9_PETCI|nr:hypothetical protein Pcinc_007904 [Petrolisthes cinctipes]KAK3895101.1 hypothetical protein Pcinc_001196 [Petrolisthes cinctipes]